MESKGKDEVPTTGSSSQTINEVRECRCMFCGDILVLKSEEEAIGHMRVCVALQEQLSSPDQFTIPKSIQEKAKKNNDASS